MDESTPRLPHFLRVARALAKVSGVALPAAAFIGSATPGCADSDGGAGSGGAGGSYVSAGIGSAVIPHDAGAGGATNGDGMGGFFPMDSGDEDAGSSSSSGGFLVMDAGEDGGV
jgi:hypothetical protein